MGETNISVPKDSLTASDCRGLADVLSSVGDKWTIMVVGALSKGRLRYNEIRRRVSGISQRMLTLTLKRLETEGIVTRTLFPSVPPRVDYELTELGQSLRAALVPLHLWAARNKQTIAEHKANSVADPDSAARLAKTKVPDTLQAKINSLASSLRSSPQR